MSVQARCACGMAVAFLWVLTAIAVEFSLEPGAGRGGGDGFRHLLDDGLHKQSGEGCRVVMPMAFVKPLVRGSNDSAI